MALPDIYEVWISHEVRGATLLCMQAVESDGQKRLIDSEEFGPFDGPADLAAWVWFRLRADMAASGV